MNPSSAPNVSKKPTSAALAYAKVKQKIGGGKPFEPKQSKDSDTSAPVTDTLTRHLSPSTTLPTY